MNDKKNDVIFESDELSFKLFENYEDLVELYKDDKLVVNDLLSLLDVFEEDGSTNYVKLESECKKMIDYQKSNFAKYGLARFAVYLKSTGELVGRAGFGPFDRDIEVPEYCENPHITKEEVIHIFTKDLDVMEYGIKLMPKFMNSVGLGIKISSTAIDWFKNHFPNLNLISSTRTSRKISTDQEVVKKLSREMKPRMGFVYVGNTKGLKDLNGEYPYYHSFVFLENFERYKNNHKI